MIKQNLTTPMFSLALGDPGVIAFGGLPGAPIRYDKTFTRAPIEFLSLNGANSYQFYTISADGFTFSGTKTSKTPSGGKSPKPRTPQTEDTISKTRTQVIIDSGTKLILLPDNVVTSINELWSPPASYDDYSDMYLVPCNASPPKLGVIINKQTFWVKSEDLVQDAGLGRRMCMSAVQSANDGASILGSAFLKSVVAVFDVGAGEMRFSARL
jgi:hypothetical protein